MFRFLLFDSFFWEALFRVKVIDQIKCDMYFYFLCIQYCFLSTFHGKNIIPKLYFFTVVKRSDRAEIYEFVTD